MSAATFEGKPCKHGHGTLRYNVGRACVVCAKAESRKQARKPGKLAQQLSANAKRRINHPEAYAAEKRRSRVKKYGITVPQYDAMLEIQGWKCAACPAVTFGRPGYNYLAVDHDTRTGDARALLCNNCNRAQGLVNHNPGTLRRLARILDEAAQGPRFKNLLEMFS